MLNTLNNKNSRPQNSNMSNIAVLGAGAWGTALAIHLARYHDAICLWSHREEQASSLSASRENKTYLPGHTFPSQLSVTSDLSAALDQADAVLIVVPSHVFSQTLRRVVEIAPNIKQLAWATKGFDPSSRKLLHQLADEILPENLPYAVLSGPTFANEVASALPTAMVSASALSQASDFWLQQFHYGQFRMYQQSDVAGVEVGGAYKNIMAIATGISDGLGLGANARAALVARGVSEMIRFGVPLGATPETLMGLAGLGDLVLTCTDDLSRNRRFGLELAKTSKKVEQVIADIGQVVEGVKAVKVVVPMASEMCIELPIAEQVFQLVNGTIDARQAAQNLMGRGAKLESLG